MYCALRNKRWQWGLVLAAILTSVPAGVAGSQSAAPSFPSVAAARAEVLRSEQRLTEVTAARDAARNELSGLTASSAELARNIADARAEVRRRATGAYVSGTPDEAVLVILGGDDLYDASARVRLMAHAADRSSAAVDRYNELKDDVDPAIVDLGVRLQRLEQDVLDANDAVLAARATEAEAERQEARRALEAQRARAAAAAAAAARRASTATTPTNSSTAAAAGTITEAPAGPITVAPPGGPSEAQWAALRNCEASGNYRAVSASGKYRGAYQFDARTWAGLGPAGDPAAAPPAEQDARAKLLYSQRGWRPWPLCGRFLR